MTDSTLSNETKLRADLLALVDELVPLLMEPSRLYDEGTREIVAEHGENYPITALPENEKATQAYNMVPELIADAVMRMRSVVGEHLAPSGAQMAYADGAVLARSLEFQGPMHLVKADRFLYPQYDGKLSDWASSPEVQEWLAKEAQKRLLEPNSTGLLADAVRRRYEMLAVSAFHPEETL